MPPQQREGALSNGNNLLGECAVPRSVNGCAIRLDAVFRVRDARVQIQEGAAVNHLVIVVSILQCDALTPQPAPSSARISFPPGTLAMLNEQNDSYLLYMNGKPVAIGPDFDTTAKLAESVLKERPGASLLIRVADRLTRVGLPDVDPRAQSWHFDRTTLSWREGNG